MIIVQVMIAIAIIVPVYFLCEAVKHRNSQGVVPVYFLC